MRYPPGQFAKLWTSGEVYRLAAQVRSAAELAEKLGLSPDALVSQMQRLRRAGHDIPTLTEIIEFARSSGVWSEAAEDEWDVEPTSPDLSAKIYPEGGYPAGSGGDGDWRDIGQGQAGKRPEVQFRFQGSEPKVPDPHKTEARVKDLAGAIPYGTPMERASAEAFIRLGSVAAAAAEMQLTPEQLRAHLSELERRAAARGWSPAHDMTKTVPAGYSVKGVSTYYDAEGLPRGQWVRSRRDEEQRMAALMEAVQHVSEPFKGAHDPVQPPSVVDDDLLAVIPIGDAHVGLYAWAAETGDDFDLGIAESLLVGAVDHLVSLAPPAKQALIINLGDWYHSDNSSNQTSRSKHSLDVDTRWPKVLAVGVRIMRRMIDRALEKHERVRVINEIGNHDDHSSVFLSVCLANYYERDPRVEIDTSPARHHWHRFGKCLIGVTHGDQSRSNSLLGVMAADRAKDWGETEHRYWYVGHIHTETVREYPGVVVESFRTLAGKDAWAAGAGYRSGRDLRLDILHREYGRINRHIVGIGQLTRKNHAA